MQQLLLLLNTENSIKLGYFNIYEQSAELSIKKSFISSGPGAVSAELIKVRFHVEPVCPLRAKNK